MIGTECDSYRMRRGIFSSQFTISTLCAIGTQLLMCLSERSRLKVGASGTAFLIPENRKRLVKTIQCLPILVQIPASRYWRGIPAGDTRHGALVPLNSLGVFFLILKLAVPFTWGIDAIRSVIIGGGTAQSHVGNLTWLGLMLQMALLLLLGVVIFKRGYEQARERNLLGSY